jgi:hypothetical protein
LPSNRLGYVSVDAYHTRFTSQIMADRDADAQEIRFVQAQNATYASSLQVEANLEVLKGLEVRLAWKGYDVQQLTGGTLQPVALLPTHRVLANAGWKRKQLALDLTAQWYGRQRLPGLQQATVADYTVLLGQATWQQKTWAIYVGGENLLNFTQRDLIRGAADWTAPDFDASMVWGPAVGRMLYAGLRWELAPKKKAKPEIDTHDDHIDHEGH